MARARSRERGGLQRHRAGSDPTDDLSLGDRFINVMRLMRVSSSRADIAGLSNARYEFLHALVHSGPGRMSSLARQLQISPRTVTPMVDALEADGLIARAQDPNDRRAQVITLTTSGLELMRRAHAERIARTDDLFAALDAAERATLGALLDTIIATAAAGPRGPIANRQADRRPNFG